MSAESEKRRTDRKGAYLDMLYAAQNGEWEDAQDFRYDAFTVDEDLDIKKPTNTIIADTGGMNPSTTGPYCFIIQDAIRVSRDVNHIRKTREQLFADQSFEQDIKEAVNVFPYIPEV